MEIPKSLDSVWKNVSQDKTITKKDYDLLVKAAAPTGKNSEFDNSEVEFLGKLKSELEKPANASKGSIPVNGLSFTQATPPKVISEADIKDVPATLKESWNKAIEDGNINQDDYKSLISVASPNWDDAELDPKEKEFLGNLQALLKASDNNLTITKPAPVAKPEQAPVTQETTENNPTAQTDTKPEKPETASSEPSTPVEPFKEVKIETDESLQALNNVNSLLDDLGDDPDFAPLRGIVNQRLANSTAAKQFTADTNTIISSIEPGKLASVNQGKAQLQSLYDNLPQGVKANPEITNIFTHAMGTLDSQLSASRNKGTTGTSTPKINVPDSLKAEWDKVAVDGKINLAEYNQLVKAAAPNGQDTDFDQQELDFLSDIKTKVQANKGVYSFVDSNESNGATQESTEPANKPETNSPAKPKKPILLNWPGYTSETKGALKSAFGSRVNGTSMPLLASPEGLKIAKAFGVQNIKQLQQLVKAKADGRFGPETFFKAKVYIANEMNKPDADPVRINQMLSALGNDREVKLMKQSASNKKPESPSVQQDQVDNENKDNGVPESLKTKWNEVIADGKLSKADYDQLISAASPNKKNEEFDDSELKFLASFKEKFKNTDEIAVEKPAQQTAQNQSADQPQSIEDSIPATLKNAWKAVTTDGKLTKADYQKLVEAASPNKKNTDFDDSELEFLATIKDMFDKNKVDVLDVAKPQVATKPVEQKESADQPQSIEDSIPATLKNAWKAVTTDGKLTKADYQKLVEAASPNKKNTDFDNSELEFLATIKDMFDKNKVDVLDVAKPQVATKPVTKPSGTQKPVTKPVQTTTTQPKPNSPVFSFTPPQSLKAAWDEISADGKVTSNDFAKLVLAAAPGKQNTEFENDEIEFLADLKKKLAASDNVISVAKK